MIPCYIQNRDTLCVQGMVEKLWMCEQAVPVVMDCGSTYPPLLEWYAEAERNGLSVIRVDPVHQNKTAWVIEKRLSEPLGVYAVSDGDLDLSAIPTDFLVQFREVLLEAGNLIKVGCHLKIDDLPVSGPLSERVHTHTSLNIGNYQHIDH